MGAVRAQRKLSVAVESFAWCFWLTERSQPDGVRGPWAELVWARVCEHAASLCISLQSNGSRWSALLYRYLERGMSKGVSSKAQRQLWLTLQPVTGGVC